MRHVTLETVRRRLAAHRPERAPSDRYIEAAVALVLAVGDGGALDLLFIKRAKRDGDPWSGQMALPGGRREPHDADLLATAQRETWEETGIALPADAVLGALDDLEPVTPVLPPVMVRPWVFGLGEQPPVRPGYEVQIYVWAPLAELPRAEMERVVTVRGADRRVPAFVVGSHVVWGITHRIVRGFLALLG